MSKKEQAIELFQTITNAASWAVFYKHYYMSNKSLVEFVQDMYSQATHYNDIKEQSEAKLEVLMGEVPAANFKAAIYQKSVTFGCNEDNYSFEKDEYSAECIIIAGEIGLNILETWVWTD